MPDPITCPHCGSTDIDPGGTGLDMCRACGGMSRNGLPLVAHAEVPGVWVPPAQPGPASIPPHTTPGGTICYVYAVPSGRLLDTAVAHAGWPDSIPMAAFNAGRNAQNHLSQALAGGETGVTLVFYSGDTGERLQS